MIYILDRNPEGNSNSFSELDKDSDYLSEHLRESKYIFARLDRIIPFDVDPLKKMPI